MSVREDLEWAKNEADPAMREILRRGLGEAVDPDREVLAGGYEQAIEYVRVERDKYVAEVGKREGNYIYHFWPRTAELLPTFGDKLGDAMLKVFKYPERLASKHDEIVRCFEGADTQKTEPMCSYWGAPDEFVDGVCPNCHSTNTAVSMSSWAVRVTGFADNPLADDLAASVFNELDKLL